MIFKDFIEQFEPLDDDERALAREAFFQAGNWWMLGADMWLAAGQDNPVPGTWGEAKEMQGNAPDFPCADDDKSAAWTLRNLLTEHAEGAYEEELLYMLEEAYAEGAYEGWKTALKAQEGQEY